MIVNCKGGGPLEDNYRETRKKKRTILKTEIDYIYVYKLQLKKTL